MEDFAKRVWCDLTWDGMEVVLFEDGSNEVRAIGCYALPEVTKVIYTVSLDPVYWEDSIFMNHDNDDYDKLIPDDNMYDQFIHDLVKEIQENIF